jgi:hypothetical protein
LLALRNWGFVLPRILECNDWILLDEWILSKVDLVISHVLKNFGCYTSKGKWKTHNVFLCSPNGIATCLKLSRIAIKVFAASYTKALVAVTNTISFTLQFAPCLYLLQPPPSLPLCIRCMLVPTSSILLGFS